MGCVYSIFYILAPFCNPLLSQLGLQNFINAPCHLLRIRYGVKDSGRERGKREKKNIFYIYIYIKTRQLCCWWILHRTCKNCHWGIYGSPNIAQKRSPRHLAQQSYSHSRQWGLVATINDNKDPRYHSWEVINKSTFLDQNRSHLATSLLDICNKTIR